MHRRVLIYYTHHSVVHNKNYRTQQPLIFQHNRNCTMNYTENYVIHKIHLKRKSFPNHQK